ncbi:MAG: RNA polymerase sigma factor [Bdellovibrionales bacterium]
MTNVNWASLVEGLKKKDPEITRQFVDLTHQKLFEFCYYLCSNRQLAEDLCHDALLKALAQIHQLKEADRAMAWLKRIARNLLLDFQKSAEQSRTLVMDPEDEKWLAHDQKISEESMDAVQTLKKLDSGDREILILIEIQGHSYQEVAEILDLNIGTVKSRLHRARAEFSKKFIGTKSSLRSSIV